MRISKMLAVCGIAVLMSGCVVSLHPLFTDENLVFEEGLVGTWFSEDGDVKWRFQKAEDKVYGLTVAENEAPGKFEARLVRLGKFLFLDLYPKEPDIDNDFYKLHLLPAHGIMRVWLEGDLLRVAMIDYDWLNERIKEKKADIAHEILDGRIVLTASTEDLQEFYLKYAEDNKAFSDPGELHRQK
jgi:hypothetical protein